jgi:hypothetical protein
METIDTLRETMSNHVCERHRLHPFMNDAGSHITILCCCKQFNSHLKTEIETTMGKEYVRGHLRFITGYVDYL